MTTYTHGLTPADVVQDSTGRVVSGVNLNLYGSLTDATNQTNLLYSVTTNSLGRWSTTATQGSLWVRDPAGNVWESSAQEEDPTQDSRLVALEANANGATLDLSKQTGVDNTGATECSAAINSVITSATSLGVRVVGRGTYKIANTVTITCSVDLEDATFNSTCTGVSVQVGAGTSGTILFYAHVRLPKVINTAKTGLGWTGSTIGVQATNTYGCVIRVQQVQGFATGYYAYGLGTGNVYNDVLLQKLDNNKRNLVLGAGTGGWSNSNTYHLGSLSHNSGEGSAVVGTRQIQIETATAQVNGNKFIGGSVEGGVAEYHLDCDGLSNTFDGLRWENAGGCRVIWQANAQRNVIQYGYNANTIVETFVAGQAFNRITTTDTTRIVGSTTKALVVYENDNSAASAADVVMDPGATQAGSDPASGYRVYRTANSTKMKQAGDVYDRIILDHTNGRVYLGNGTSAPTSYIGQGGSSGGFIFTGGSQYFSPDNTLDVGPSSLRPRYVYAGTAFIAPQFVTGSRPAASSVGAGGNIYDSTLSKPLWSDGTVYRDALGNSPASTFRPESYGAKANGKLINDAAITTGTAILTSPGGGFAGAVAGQYVYVASAGGFANVPLVTTIASVQSSTQVTLAANAAATVSGKGCIWGTDDTAAVQSAINAATTYAQTSGAATILFGEAIYVIAGAPGGTNMLAQLQLPAIADTSPRKVNLTFQGARDATSYIHWKEPGPPTQGSVLFSMYYNDASQTTTPPRCVIGGPVTGYGHNNGTFSNMKVVWDGVNILAAHRSCISGLDLYGVAQAHVKSFSYHTCSQAGSATGTVWPVMRQMTGSNPSAWKTFGYRSPTVGNNALNVAGIITVYNAFYGVVFADHFNAQNVGVIGANAALVAGANDPCHYAFIGDVVSEDTDICLYCDTTGDYGFAGQQPIFIAALGSEDATTLISDPNNSLRGEIHIEQLNLTPPFAGMNGAKNVRILYDGQNRGAIASPPAVPASATALANGYWRDITVVVSGGTVSQIAIDGVNQGVTSGPVTLPTGSSITLTYTVAPTWTWQIR